MLKFTLGLVLLSPCAASAADCHVDPFRFTYGSDTQTHMDMKQGGTCGHTLHERGGGLSSVGVAQNAQNGTASVSGSRWDYRPRKGFTGHDTFVVQVSGESMSNRRGSDHKGTANITVDVDVTP